MQLKISNEIIKKEYPILGAKLMSEKYGLSRRYFICRASLLRIKVIRHNKLDRYCSKCNKIIAKYQKNTLCRNCTAKERYKLRGVFSHNNSKLWNDVEIDYLIKNYTDTSIEELTTNLNRNWSSIMHKAYRLGLKRNPKFMIEGNLKGREIFKLHNPTNNLIAREKARASLIKLYQEHPEKLLNARLKRNQMTNIEKKVSEYLDSIEISYEWNKYIKTVNTFRFPDFKIGNLIIECDGMYWHNKTKEQDISRQKELEALGFKVIRFNDSQILKNFEEVKNCIQLELNQLKK
jgi:very-short-patch-repair endonuclease